MACFASDMGRSVSALLHGASLSPSVERDSAPNMVERGSALLLDAPLLPKQSDCAQNMGRSVAALLHRVSPLLPAERDSASNMVGKGSALLLDAPLLPTQSDCAKSTAVTTESCAPSKTAKPVL